MLAGEGLIKRYRGRAVLDRVSVGVPPGRITALVGPSGGGKSTLLRTLARLEPTDAGRVTVDGVEHPVPPGPGFWPGVTVVFQQLFLWPHLTLRGNILLPHRDRPAADLAGRVEELADALRMGEFLDRYPNQVSVGQRQRAAVARAIALRPRYLLLDEVTSALDPEHVGRLLDLLVRVRGEGTGILLVTHLLRFAQRSADHVVFMEDGAVVASGGPDLLTAPGHPRLVEFVAALAVAG